MSISEPHAAAPMPRIRWFQFSMRAVLAVITISAISCSWLAVKMRAAKRQREAVEAIVEAGAGWVGYDYNFDQMLNWKDAEPPAPKWIRHLLGDDFFADVVFVSFRDTGVRDSALEHIKMLDRLRGLDLRNTQVTDAGLEQLKGQTELQVLEIPGTGVTELGMKKLQQALPKCSICK